MLEAQKNTETEKSLPQILAICIACIAPFVNGLLFSWSSPSIVRIVNDHENYDISAEEASYFTVLPPIAAIITALMFAYLCDKIGRKKTMLLMAIPQTLAWILIAVAKSVYVFYVSRLLAGIGDACLFCAVPMYIGEVSTPKVRGTWGNMLTFSIYFGQFTINVLGGFLSIPQTAYVGVVFPILFGVSFYFMPETPYYLIMKERFEDAKGSLRRLRGKTDVEEEFMSLQKDVNRQMSEQGTWKDLFVIQSNRKSLLAGLFLRGSQQFGGISAFVVYTQYIFEKSGGDLDPVYSAIIFTGLVCLFNLIAGSCLDKLGRRRGYMLSCVFSGIVLFIEAVYFYIDQYSTDIDVSSLNWIPLAGLIAYVVFYSFGMGIVPTQMLGELFSASVKGKGLTVLNIFFGVLVSSVTKLFFVLQTQIGMFAPFLLFSICCLLSSIFSLYFVPETKGKTLEEIQLDMRSKKTKR